MSQVTWINGSTVVNGAASTSVVLARPAGTVDGHLLMAAITQVGVGTIIPPAGWLLVHSQDNGTAMRIAVYRRPASAEPSTWTWTLGAAVRACGWVGAYSGADTLAVPAVRWATEVASVGAVVYHHNGVPTPVHTTHEVRWLGVGAAVRTATGVASTWASNLSNERADLSTNAGAGTDVSLGVHESSLIRTSSGGVGLSFGLTQQTQSHSIGIAIGLPSAFDVPRGGPLPVVVEAAFGADPDGDPAGWTWTDISPWVRPGVAITKGRENEAGQPQPTRIALELDNSDGRFTPFYVGSPYYPHVRLNTPMRVSVDGVGIQPPYRRAVAFVDQWPTSWTPGLLHCYVPLTASGRTRRYGRSEVILRSAVFRAMTRLGDVYSVLPHAYWPMEDGPGAATIASGIGGQALVPSGTVQMGADATMPGSAALPTIGAGGQIKATIPSYGDTGRWLVELMVKVPAAPAATTTLLQVTASGTARTWRVDLVPIAGIDEMHIRAFDAAGASILDDAVIVSSTEGDFYGHWVLISICVVQSGANVDYLHMIWNAGTGGGNAGTLVGRTTGLAVAAAIPASAGIANTSVGHLGVYVDPTLDQVFTPSVHAEPIGGYAGELPAARFSRLCTEEGVPYEIVAPVDPTLVATDPAIPMGPQPIATFLGALEECAEADVGLIHDGGRDGGLVLVTRSSRYNAAVDLALTQSKLSTLEPTYDDQQIVNEVTAIRPGGSSRTASEPDEHIATEGRYRKSVTVNVANDNQLLNQAALRVHLGTTEGMRYPQVGLDLLRTPELIRPWVQGGRIGSRLTITHALPQSPPDPIDLMIEGFTEYLDAHEWRVSATCSPAEPYRVGVLDDPVLGRLDTAGCELGAAVTSTGTSLTLVTTSGPLWTEDSGEYPLDLRVGGERVTATAMTHSAPTFVAAGVAAHAVNASVAPGLPAGLAAGHLILLFGAIRNSGAGSLVTPAGYHRILGGGTNWGLWCKVAGSSESAPTVAITGGVAGADVSAQTAAWSGSWSQVAGLVRAQADVLNPSAQDIRYPGLVVRDPGCLVVYCGWKQANWTSVVGPGTEIGEPNTTTGDDQGLVWGFAVQATASSILSGAQVVTGGVSAISRGAVVALRPDTQTATVTRSVNGVSVAHGAGDQVSLWTPLTLAL